ncbi:DNA repair protein RecN [Wenzhouxiangella marina]|nr:DNA repair protein RecN [Wenzhouxiangella marina]MBB6086026.1 DNA repair protein RecN (Recombination protein N) [Wenzhouxiangella marina]
MLRALSIRQFAIIDALELDFDSGFTAITGETGAGKSILIDALGLLLGNRADSSLVAQGEDQAELSARFELTDACAEARAWLQDQAMEEGDELILRRVLSAQGQSRAWINGRSATVGQLAQLGNLLVEIHGQHEHQRLERPEVQRALLDQRLDPELARSVRDAHSGFAEAARALEDFEQDAGDPNQLDLLRFQSRELGDLALQTDEYERLEAEQERLARSDELRSAIAQAARILDGDAEANVRAMLGDAQARLQRVRELDPELASVADMLDEAAINIDEAIASLERLDRDEDEDAPERLEKVNRRLERALDLARKHRVEPAELPELTQRLQERLDRLENQGEEREQLERARDRALETWRRCARALYEAREQAGKALAAEVDRHLAELGMDHARLRFDIEHDEQARPAVHGADRVRILFAANPGQEPKPLTRVASGGELSRVSLALMIAVKPERGPVVRIFDEVDAGIGGQTAAVVGDFLRRVAGQGQAFCVTHLAQVAACASHQFQVSKASQKGKTQIRVLPLDPESRREEIARMLGGPMSDKSREHAEELLAAARSG